MSSQHLNMVWYPLQVFMWEQSEVCGSPLKAAASTDHHGSTEKHEYISRFCNGAVWGSKAEEHVSKQINLDSRNIKCRKLRKCKMFYKCPG